MKSYFLQALRGINHNKSRTLLTTLGIMIGIATVIMVFSLGEGLKSFINDQIESYGTNNIFIETVIPTSTKAREAGKSASGNDLNTNMANIAVPITTLKNRDIEDIRKLPNIRTGGGAIFSQQPTTYKDVSKMIIVMGTDVSRFDMESTQISLGRPYTQEEENSLAQVAILGSNVAKDFFPNIDPVGKLIRMGNYNFEVIGVYEEKGGLGAGDDDQIFIPLRTLQKKFLGVDYVNYIIVQLIDGTKADITALDIKDVLRRNHQINDPSKDDFSVQTQAQTMDTFNTILNAVTFLLIAIALISLIVGGVGVMNIMYVIVTERIGEIGLKKALGATNKDILYEFLIEAILLTLIGGVVGIIIGSSLSFIISEVAQSMNFAWEFIVPLYGIIIAVSISMIIGIVFGVFPARNASLLNPIEALNKE